MPERGWLETGDFTAYPFLVEDIQGESEPCPSSGPDNYINAQDLPRRGFADVGFCLGPLADFTSNDVVTLYGFIIGADTIVFDFRSTADGLGGYRWRFVCPIDASFGCTMQTDAEEVSSGTKDADRGFGFLTVGNLEELVALGAGTYLLCSLCRVEPALLQNLADTYVRSINIGNDARLCPAECCEEDPDDGGAYIYATGIGGDVRLLEGNNIQIITARADNALEVNAVVGAGEGETCKDVLIVGDGPENFIPEGGSSTCALCSDFVRSVDGIITLDGKLWLSTGPGLKLQSDSPNTLTLTLEDLACE